jgi:hypothetical protein
MNNRKALASLDKSRRHNLGGTIEEHLATEIFGAAF